MTITHLKEVLEAETIVDGFDQHVSSVYAGDFLSRVMGKAPMGCAWLTIMGNVNVAGVAVLADVRVIVLCEGVRPDALLVQKCQSEKITLVVTNKSVYEACKLL